MVSIAPNQFKIEGKIVSIHKDEQLENFVSMVVQLEKVEHLQGPEQFLDSSLDELTVSVQDELASTVKEGMHISCKIRKAPGRFFIIPDSLKSETKR